MKRVFCLILLFLLSACVTGQGETPPAAVPADKAARSFTENLTDCGPGEVEWSAYLAAVAQSGAEAARPHLECAAAAGQVEAMTALGTELTEGVSNRPGFERGIGLLRAAAIAGEERAQRMLAFRYQAGKGWIGRNAYLALFWTDIANRDDPFYLSAPKTGGLLEKFRDHLSDRSRQMLAQRVTAWRPGIAEPPNYTFDILMTAVLRDSASLAWAPNGVAPEPAIDYGLRSGFPDAPLLGLMFGFRGNRDRIPDALLAEMSAKGSLTAMMLELRRIGSQKGREAEENALIYRLLARLGLDIRYLQPHHDTVLTAFSEDRNLDALLQAIAEASPPERSILATIGAMISCNPKYEDLCGPALSRVEPLITPTALNYLVFVHAMDRCDDLRKRNACLLENGGMAALRDMIVSDLIDQGGRST